MLEWLVPICLYWILAATYLGGWPVDLQGGNGFTQILGLLATFALYMVLFGVLRALGGGFGVFGSLLIPVTVTSIGLPFITMAAYRVFGIKIVRRPEGVH